MSKMPQRGDTIIEVLLATTVFSLVSTGAMVVMNQGTNTAQRSLEITHVRQQIDAQAEAIRAAQQAAQAGKPDNWNIVRDKPISNYFASASDKESCPAANPTDRRLGAGAFVMNTRTGAAVTNFATKFKYSSDVTAPPYPQLRFTNNPSTPTELDTAYGIWIEKQTETGGSTFARLYTFVVNACWLSPGLDVPVKLETAVRLYDPS